MVGTDEMHDLLDQICGSFNYGDFRAQIDGLPSGSKARCVLTYRAVTVAR
jgi:hypothetical protein